MANIVKKLVLVILVLLGFGTSMLYLQNRATNPRYLIPVKINIYARSPFSRTPEFLKLNPNDEYDDAKEPFQAEGLHYTFSSSRIMKSVAVRLANQAEANKIFQIVVSLGDRAFTYDGSDIAAHWGFRAEKSTVLLELKDRLQYSKSVLARIGQHYSVMNWPGDRTLLSRFFRDQPWIFILHLLLFAACLAVIFVERPLQRLFSRAPLGRVNGRINASPWAQSLLLFCLFFMVAFVIRFLTLNQTTSMDEGTFITIGERVAKGAALYRDVWDTKSPGFFFYYALVLSVAHSLFLVKLIGLVVTSLTALVLGWIIKKLVHDGSPTVPILTGLSYILVSSIADSNFCINPEQLVVLFSGLSIVMILRDDLLSIFVVGISLGLSFIIKYPAGLDLAAVGILWLIFSLRKGRSLTSLLPAAGVALVGFLVPFLMTIFYFNLRGILDVFFRNNLFFDLTSYSRRMTIQGILSNCQVFIKNYWPFAILGLIGFVCLVRSKPLRKLAAIVGIWGLSSLAAILLPSQQNINYWFQFWGALSLAVPFGVIEVLRWFGDVPASRERFSSALVVVSAVAILTVTATTWIQFNKENYPLEIAETLSGRIEPQDRIFILWPSAQVDYFYLDMMPPSPYVHGFGRPDSEVKRVFDLKPRFLVTTEDYNFKQQWESELNAFHLLYRAGSFEVFERNQG
jgi:hypothetical protein